MEAIFLKILNMSITAGWMILAVVILRLVFKNAPKFVRCILWGLVAIRLICPVSFESVLSLVPSAETVTKQSVSADNDIGYNMSTGISAVDNKVEIIFYDKYLEENYYKDMSDNETGTIVKNEGSDINVEVTNAQSISIMSVVSYVWIAGVVILLIYSVVIYVGIYRKVSVSIRLRENIFICDNIDSPFILGIIRPRIYLPSIMNEKEMNYVLAHENAHIARFDYLWKPLGFVILSVYWFNPVIWMAYILLCRDIEFACDERVIRYMNVDDKKEYSRTLLSCSVSHRMIAACPVAFGEVAVGRRVKTVLNYKKPAFWMMSMAIVACVVVAVCFLTNPKTYADEACKEETGDNTAEDMKEVVYRYKHEYEDVELWIMLEPETKTYRMSENFSIYDAVSVGKYDMTEDKLVLTDVLSIDKQYVFFVEDNALVFDAEKSSKTLCFAAPKDSLALIPQTGGLTKEDLEQIYEDEGYTIYEAMPNGAVYYICEDGEARNEVVEVFSEYVLNNNAGVEKTDSDSIFESPQEELIFTYEDIEGGCIYRVYLNTKYNTFKMTYDVFSYCAASGYYVLDENKIILTDFNEPEKYVFEIVDGQLVFVADESTEMPLYAHNLNEEKNYTWVGRMSDETFDESAYEKYSNDSNYELVRLVNDGDVFRGDLLTEEEYELQLYYFRESFKEGFVKWD